MPQPLHALLLPWPALGHINPIMQLASFLSAAGVGVTLVNTQFNHRRLVRSLQQKSALAAVPNANGRNSNGEPAPFVIPDVVQLDELLGEDLLYIEGWSKRAVAPIRLIGIPDGVRDEDYIVMDFFKISAALYHSVDRVLEIAQSLSPPLTSVIGDVFSIWTSAVGERLAIPHLGFWTQSAASFAAHVVFTNNPTHFKELMTMDVDVVESRPIVGIPGCPALKPTEVVTFLQSCDMSEFFFNRLTHIFKEVILKHTHVLINTFDELEPEALAFVKGLGANVMEIGPMLSTKYMRGGGGTIERKDGGRISLWTEDEQCVAWLDWQEVASVLYVSFGSLALLSEAELAELAAGLEASGCRILMVARRALAHGKDAVFPDSLAMSEKVRFVEWAPQLAVLAHPSVGGFLTHAGWNSTTEAIANGVPMICWPTVGDQMMNCRGIVDYWRIGLELHKDPTSGLVERKEIESKVKRLMDPASSKDIRERALELSTQARECRRNSSEANLQSMLRSIANNVSMA